MVLLHKKGRLAVLGVLLVLSFVSAGRPGLAATDGSSEQAPVENPAEPQVLRLMLTGDLYLGNWAEKVSKQKGPGYLFAGVQPLLDRADVLAGNYDGVLSLKGSVLVPKEYTLRSDPAMAKEMASAGYDFLSLANNHTMDFGPAALFEMLKVLDENGIRYAGAGRNLAEARRAAFVTVDGVKFAFLAYSRTYPEDFWATSSKPGTAFAADSQVKADVAAVRPLADVVVVSFHWGGERVTVPRGYQVSLARLSIDSGADVVFGHHPHVLQGIEIYRGKVIAYSLGNFLFGFYTQNAKDSVLLEVVLRDRKVSEVRFYPVCINNSQVQFQTRPYDAANAARVIGEMRALSAAYGTVIENVDGVGVVKVP